MESIQVLRIENEEGIGIFHSLFVLDCKPILERHRRFNTPQTDRLDLHQGKNEWFCAYKSIDQFQQWIEPEECKLMKAAGFTIYLLTVSEFQIGRDQVIFTKEGILERKDVTELFI